MMTGMKIAGRAFQVPIATSLSVDRGWMGYFRFLAIKYM